MDTDRTSFIQREDVVLDPTGVWRRTINAEPLTPETCSSLAIECDDRAQVEARYLWLEAGRSGYQH